MTGDGEPLAVTVTAPGACRVQVLDVHISDGPATASGELHDSSNVRVHALDGLAGATGDVGSTAGSVVEMGLALSLTDLLP